MVSALPCYKTSKSWPLTDWLRQQRRRSFFASTLSSVKRNYNLLSSASPPLRGDTLGETIPTTLAVPIQEPNQEPNQEPMNVNNSSHLGAPGFVLIIEDDDALASLIPQVLMRLWPVTSTVYGVASTMRQARCIITEKGNIPDLVILDLYLPDSSGIETIDKIVDIVPETTGILAVSAYLSHIEGKEALAHGATRFLTKQGKFDPVTIMDMAGRSWLATKGFRLRLRHREEKEDVAATIP